MKDNFDRSFAMTLKYEGGYVNDPQDPGGATNLGVTLNTLSSFNGRPATIADVKALTPAKVKPIYQKRYWDMVEGDRLPGGLDLAVYDWAVNSGPRAPVQALQRVLGVRADGVMGDDTLMALRGKDAHELLDKVCDARLKFLRGLRTFKRFGKGWTTRVENVRKVGRTWVVDLTADDVDLGYDDFTTGSVKAREDDAAPSRHPVVQAGALTSLGTVGAACSDAAQQISQFTDSLEVMKWLFMALTLVGVGIGVYIAIKKSQE